MGRRSKRGDIRTWTLLVLALVPTWSVLAGAVWLWADRGREIANFESALVPVDTTYELFAVSSKLLRADASLHMAALPDTSADVIERAERDHTEATEAVHRSERTLAPLIDQLDPQRGDVRHGEVLALMGGSMSLALAVLDRQVTGEPVVEQLCTLVDLSRQSASGLVLPFAQTVSSDTGYFFDALAATIEYHDQFDRDRATIIESYSAIGAAPRALVSTALRDSKWKDVTDSRLFLPVNADLGWLGTSSAPGAPLLLDTTEPLGAILANATDGIDPELRDEIFLRIQDIDDQLEGDVDLAYSALRSDADSHLESLRRERRLTAVTSFLMALLGLALAALTIAEVRQRQQVEDAHSDAVQQLSEKADRDPTTGIWNRRRLESAVGRMIGEAPEANEIVVLAYLDLDHFKAINDVWGHSTGDHVLRTVTDRLNGFTYGDVPFELCRFGGDEFVLYAQMPQHTLDWFEGLGTAIIDAVDSEMAVNGRRHEVGASVGIATSTAESTLDSLLLEADSSLILAKRQRGVAVVYDRNISRTGELVHALPCALANGEICVHIQPVIDIRTGAVEHVEALARWNRIGGEQVSPAVFVPLVESYGLAEKLTSTILGCAGNLIGHPSTPANVRVWVNVSPRELDVANFSERFVSILQQLNLPPSRIGLEITETAAVRDPQRLAKELRLLREVGIAVAIDDFGSGYSPLGYLRLLPVDVVKLDRSLIANIDQDRANQHIVIGIVGLASELGIGIVAEGVERIEECEWLIGHDVHFVQGFLFDRPVDPKSFDWTQRSVARTEPAPARVPHATRA